MAKQWNIPSNCPVCGGYYEITQLECVKCHSNLHGHFKAGRFDKLTAEQLRFIEVFLICRGNIREVEKQLGISYPTVRSRLDESLAVLGLLRPKQKDDTTEMLEALSRGELSVEDVMEKIEKSRKSGGI